MTRSPIELFWTAKNIDGLFIACFPNCQRVPVGWCLQSRWEQFQQIDFDEDQSSFTLILYTRLRKKISMKICETNYSLMFTQDTSHSLQFYIFHAFCNKECNWIVYSPCTHYAGLYSLFSILYNNSFTKLFFLIDASCCTNDNHCVPRGPSYVGGSYSLSPQGAKVLLCLCNNQLMLKKLYLWCKNY